MAMPFFTPGDDPGSSFPELLRRIGHAGSGFDGDLPAGAAAGLSVPHATTCVALRFADGVVIAGDRRATSGNLISHRGMEKVVQADRFSGVAIAGAAGPAMEMIKLFALQLEHYEKVEGASISLEGKANQLSAMVRGNLPAANQSSQHPYLRSHLLPHDYEVFDAERRRLFQRARAHGILLYNAPLV